MQRLFFAALLGLAASNNIDFEIGDRASKTSTAEPAEADSAGAQRLFSVPSTQGSKATRGLASAPRAEADASGPWLAAACALGIAAALVALGRREQRAEQRLPLAASEACGAEATTALDV